ncbi:MAG: divalent-cation tolerance protein CutA [Candidatus Bathyarchaeia archaeon]
MKGSQIIILVTASSKEEAEKISEILLNEKLVACVNIMGPVYSSFWWMGKIDKAEEHLILMKTKRGLFNKLSKRVKAIHSYKVPEIIAVPILEGSEDYLKWIEESIG